MTQQLKKMCDFSAILYLVSLFPCVISIQKIPGLKIQVYEKPGDINIGGLFSVHSFSKTKHCGNDLYSVTRFQHIQALAYAVEKVNNNSLLLPQNITLGFIVLDDCVKPSTALAQSLHFVPRRNYVQNNESAPYYKVSGVIGPLPSSNSILAASLLGLYNIPQISPLSTSVELSDKSKYKYFLRVVPPDQYQARAIVDLIHSFGWKYISAINSEGTYGSNGVRQVKNRAAELGICVAYAKEIPQGTREEEYDDIMRALLQNKEARGVVMFVGLEEGRKLLQAAQRKAITEQFVWIFSDTFGNMNGHVGLEDVSVGSFFFKVYTVSVQDFNRYYQGLNPSNTGNPWYKQLWETVFNCSWNKTPSSTSCNKFNWITESNYKAEPTASFVIDAVYTFAHALSHLLSKCNRVAQSNKEYIDSCVSGENLLYYLRNTSFNGTAGLVEFDEKGDMLGKYVISQLQKSEYGHQVVPVGLWDMRTENLNVSSETIIWSCIKPSAGQNRGEIPMSVCSRQCTVGEFKIQKELKCCWDCRRCRGNEITTSNASQCEECPRYQWPDQKTITQCEPINPNYMKWIDPLAIAFCTVTIFGMLMCFVVIGFFMAFKNRKIIMASCPTLTFIMLFGNISAYATIFVLIVKPTEIACGVNRFGFHFSFALIYAPLLAKSSRIYRIFDSGRRGHQRPKFISTRDQVIFTIVLISIEVGISLTTLVVSPPSAILNMPVPSEKFVELLCDMPIASLVAPLAFNILLTILCLIYGFKTRKLPDNFNESWYIFLSVCSTLFLWMVFVPSYFAAFHAYHKTVVLAAALLLSSTVMLLCLYSPKIYAIFYVPEEDLTFQTNKRNQQQKAAVVWTTQVHPSLRERAATATLENHQGSVIALDENGATQSVS